MLTTTQPPNWRRRALALAATAVLMPICNPIAIAPAQACDVCAIYNATTLQETRKGLSLGIAEQFTHFATLRDSGSKVANPGEHLNSSITQVLVGYSFGPRWSLQTSIPFVTREFRRMGENGLESGHESGIGDVAMLLRYNAFNHVSQTTTTRLSILAGVKFPVGNSESLAEELVTEGSPPEEENSGVHGHDLAQGSGSTDAIVGATLFSSWKRVFASAQLQYKANSQGSAEYEFANELSYSGGPGFYALLTPDYSLALQADVSGETKGTDTQAGARVGDSAITSLYLGPRLLLTYRQSLQAEFGSQFPLIQNSSELQLVPDYRIKAGLVWRF